MRFQLRRVMFSLSFAASHGMEAGPRQNETFPRGEWGSLDVERALFGAGGTRIFLGPRHRAIQAARGESLRSEPQILFAPTANELDIAIWHFALGANATLEPRCRL